MHLCMFLSMHFLVKLWKLDDRSDDGLNGRIDPRLSEKVGFPAKNIPFCNLRDAGLQFHISQLSYFLFCGMRDAGYGITGSRFAFF